jgi:exosortase/archaeosortase
MERNILGAALLALFASVPVIRFFRSPSELLLSGLLGWGLFALTYRIFCFKFVLLEEYYSTFHVFVLGAVSYFVFATISWIGTIVWRVYATNSSHTHH